MRARWSFTFLVALGIALPLLAALPPCDPIAESVARTRAYHEAEARNRREIAEYLTAANGVQPHQHVDVQHYTLDLRIDPAARTVEGTVSLAFLATDDLSSLDLRLHKVLSVSGATLDGVPLTPSRKGANLTLRFSPPLAPGTSHEVTVTYGGHPRVTGGLGGGMMFASHQGTPSATTLSEPFDSYAWWPCVDDVTDKATADILLTVPPGMTGASNGWLVSTTVGQDGWTTFHWSEGYPLSNYLISANVTDYATFSDAYRSLDGTATMPLDYFVYPEDEAAAQQNVANLPDMIALFARQFGEYPFLQEKYGMVGFPWGGGMEHQTLTSMGDSILGSPGDHDGIYAHELAHQWWGDEVTCATWNDIWLNEGFATYLEVLWLSRHWDLDEGELLYSYYDDQKVNGYMKGSVYRKKGNDPFGDTGAVYDKGAWVLHMLKHVMGEETFLQALRDYREAHSYGNASTADLRAAFEARYGQDLQWFFDEWVYTPKRPVYKVTYQQSPSSVEVTIEQRQRHKIANRATARNVYIMPVDLTLHFMDGTDQTWTVWNDQRTQTFSIPLSKPLGSLGFDEGHWILKALK